LEQSTFFSYFGEIVLNMTNLASTRHDTYTVTIDVSLTSTVRTFISFIHCQHNVLDLGVLESVIESYMQLNSTLFRIMKFVRKMLLESLLLTWSCARIKVLGYVHPYCP